MWLLISAAVIAAAPSPQTDKAPMTAHAFFDNQSLFHGDGERVWVWPDGKVVVEEVQGLGGPLTVLRYERMAKAEELQSLREQVQAILTTPPTPTSRMGIPDEVSNTLLLIPAKGAPVGFRVWSTDWAKQPEPLRHLREAIVELQVFAKQTKQVVQGNAEPRFWPEGFPNPPPS